MGSRATQPRRPQLRALVGLRHVVEPPMALRAGSLSTTGSNRTAFAPSRTIISPGATPWMVIGAIVIASIRAAARPMGVHASSPSNTWAPHTKHAPAEVIISLGAMPSTAVGVIAIAVELGAGAEGVASPNSANLQAGPLGYKRANSMQFRNYSRTRRRLDLFSAPARSPSSWQGTTSSSFLLRIELCRLGLCTGTVCALCRQK